jgi:thiamine pyrophosphate-dependent acetolactate synthase large subunit-like protein
MSVFNSFSTKGKLVFYRTMNDEDKITISININSNHETDKDIQNDISQFLTNLLVDNYETEASYISSREAKKQQQKYVKEQEKKRKLAKKEQEKIRKQKEKELAKYE